MKKAIITILLAVLLTLSCFSLFACGDDEETVVPNYSYSITYDVKGGELPANAISEYKQSDEDIALPVPIKKGYTFIGWNNGTSVITVIAAGTKGLLSLVATWQINSYTITFDYGEGSGTETSRAVEFGAQVDDLPEATAVVGKVFAGWKTEDGEIFTNGTVYVFDKNITLTANYSNETYAINYNVNGGNPLPADAIVAYSMTEQDIALPVPTKKGYTFTGWNDGTSTITVIAAGTTETLNLTATWTVNSYTITFDYNGGSGEEASRLVEYGTAVVDLPQVTAPAGKEFVIWKLQDDGSAFVNGREYTFDKNITLVADYNINVFEIIVDNSSDYSFTDWADGSVGQKMFWLSSGEKLTMPKIAWDDLDESTKVEYFDKSFAGWCYKDKDGTERLFDPSVEVTAANLHIDVSVIRLYVKIGKPYTGQY